MRLVQRAQSFVVYDEAFPEEVFAQVQAHSRHERFKLPGHDGWVTAWRITDGFPLESRTYRLSDEPSGGAMELVFRTLEQLANQHPELVGRRGETWSEIEVRHYLYPRGIKLSWHNDFDCSAACVLYTHDRWEASWGGELLLADLPGPDGELPAAVRQEGDSEVLNLLGVGHWVSPRPNRLVLSTGAVWHMITRVDADAGDHVRRSVAAFFKRRSES